MEDLKKPVFIFVLVLFSVEFIAPLTEALPESDGSERVMDTWMSSQREVPQRAEC